MKTFCFIFNLITLESMIKCNVYFLSTFQDILVPLTPDLQLNTPVVKRQIQGPCVALWQ